MDSRNSIILIDSPLNLYQTWKKHKKVTQSKSDIFCFHKPFSCVCCIKEITGNNLVIVEIKTGSGMITLGKGFSQEK